jgi:hypothetical protein
LLLVKGIPADVCGDCGEAYLHGDVLDLVVALARTLRSQDAEVSVVRYRAA